MINWLKSLDGYGWFCLILFGPLGAFAAVNMLGALGLFMYADFVGTALNWFALSAMVVIVGPLSLFLAVAFMGAAGGGGGNFGDPNDSAAKTFVLTWAGLIVATIVLFVLPALAVLGMKYCGVYDFLRTLIA